MPFDPESVVSLAYQRVRTRLPTTIRPSQDGHAIHAFFSVLATFADCRPKANGSWDVDVWVIGDGDLDEMTYWLAVETLLVDGLPEPSATLTVPADSRTHTSGDADLRLAQVNRLERMLPVLVLSAVIAIMDRRDGVRR